MTDRWLVAILACPVCRGHPLALDAARSEGEMIEAGRLSCGECGREYVIEDGLAALLPDELDRALTARPGAWAKWRQVMDRFLTWRERAWGTRERAQKQRGAGRPSHEAFVEFCGLRSGAANVLDIGCGTGHICDLLSPECRYVGVDPLPAGRDPKLGKLPAYMHRPARDLRLVQGVGEALPFCAESFDVALVMGTLDHCNDPAQVVAEAGRVLRPHGTLAVLQGLSEGASGLGAAKGILRSAASVASRGLGVPRGPATHVRSFTAESLMELLQGRFEPCASEVVQGRAFVRARKTDEGEGPG